MKKQTKIFVKLVTESMNDVINRYAHNAADLNSYTFGWIEYDEERGSFSIGPNHGSAFHYADEVVKIAEACGMNWYITIGKNAVGNACAIVAVC